MRRLKTAPHVMRLESAECHQCFSVCSEDDQKYSNHQAYHFWSGKPDISQVHHLRGVPFAAPAPPAAILIDTVFHRGCDHEDISQHFKITDTESEGQAI